VHSKNVNGYDETKVYEEFYGWRTKMNRLERFVPLPARDGAKPATPEWESFAQYHSEASNSAELAERLRCVCAYVSGIQNADLVRTCCYESTLS